MAQLPFAVRSGACTSTTAKVGVVSLSSGTASITCGNYSASSALSGFATDADGINDDGANPGAYSHTFTVTGLSENTQYPYTVTIGADSITGTLHTNPGDNNFTAFFVSCDVDVNGTNSGLWTHIKSVAQSTPVAAVIHVDDHGYADSRTVDDRGAGGTNRFYTVAPKTDKQAYNYTVAHCDYLGLMGDATAGSTGRWHTTDRQWCHQNIPVYTQVGDHEFTGNPGENTRDAGLVTAATEAYKNTIGIARPDEISANSLAWVHTLGPIQLVAPDRCTNASTGGIAFNITTSMAQGNPVLGSAQIGDILGAIDTTSPFKILCMACGMSGFLMDRAARVTALSSSWAHTNFGAQQPLEDYAATVNPQTITTGLNGNGTTVTVTLTSHGYTVGEKIIVYGAADAGYNGRHVVTHVTSANEFKYAASGTGVNDSGMVAKSEYQALMLERTGTKGILALGKDNNFRTVVIRGDTHYPQVKYVWYPAHGDDTDEDFIEIACGSVNGSTNQRLHPALTYPKGYQGASMVWHPSDVVTSTGAAQINNENCVRLDISGQVGKRVMSISILDTNGNTIRTESVSESGSNLPVGFFSAVTAVIE